MVTAGLRRFGEPESLPRTESRPRFVDRPYCSVHLLLLLGAGLLGFGMLMAVSTTIAASQTRVGTGAPSMWSQAIKEAEFVALGLPLLWFAARLPPRTYRMLAYPMMLLSVLALLAVLVPGIGVSLNGARRWIALGPLQLQPSELAKFALLLWGADLLARKQKLGTLRQARHLFLPLLPGFGLIAMLVMLEPDLGTTCTVMLILLGLLWMIGMPLRYFAVVVLAVAGAVFALAVAAPYRLERLSTFLHPFKDPQNSGFHTVEGLYAFASGGLFGVGLGQGTSKYGWVPNASSDYVFAIIGEELGLLGAIVVLALFGLLAYSGLRIAGRTTDPFVRLAAGGATAWLCGQAIINIGYVAGLLPVTGIPLPFISAGGTSLLLSFIVLGMLVSFARHEPSAVAAARAAAKGRRRSRADPGPAPTAHGPRRLPTVTADTRLTSAASAAARAATADTPSAPAAPAAGNSGGGGRTRPAASRGRPGFPGSRSA